jgi:membrane protease YdiL (CAAX protease family)
VVSSIVFGVLHTNAVAGFAVGLLYGQLYRGRGRLGDAVLAHAVTNALVAIEALALGHHGRW